MISASPMTEIIKNKNNIIPMVGATIGTLATVMAVALILSPTLFGLLGIGAVAGMGFTSVLLGVIAAFSLAFVFTAVQQIITNTAVENARGKDGVDGKDGKDGVDGKDGLRASTIVVQHILDNRDTLGIEDGTIFVNDNTVQLNLSIAGYNKLTKDKEENKDVSLPVLLYNKTADAVKEVKVTFTHIVPPADLAQDGPFSVVLTAVNGESDPKKMEAEFGLNAGYLNKVALCDQSIESLIDAERVCTAMKDPIVKTLLFNLTK